MTVIPFVPSSSSGRRGGFAIAAVLAFVVAGGRAQEPNLGGAIDLASEDPLVAMQRIRTAPGYEIGLFASEKEFPELGNPLAMTFDTRGRLWVLTSPTYPHYLPGEVPDDKLVILEDANRDGRADKLTVFADRLYLPMGFELGDGGAYVSQQPNLMFLRDTDGDDRADERQIVLHGFGTEDSHHALSAFTWGPGGGLYFQEGTFLHSQVETPYGPVRVQDAAVFRYEPRTEKLSVFVSYPFANPWGHIVDRWGQNFVSDASNGNNYFGTAFSGHVDYPRKQRPMKEWTLTKVRPTSGVEFIRSRHFPDEAQGNFLINNVIGFHGTKQYRVVEDGSGFVGIEIEPLLQSSDPNFRPVALQFGPDGALYVVDWFNPLIGHMQFSLRDPRRDKTHGRVWRVTAKGRPLLDPPRIHGQPVTAQLELLKAYEDRTRYQARLALRDRPAKEVVPALGDWVATLPPANPEREHHLLEALWVYQHHDVVEPALLRQLLGAKEFRARAAAVRVLHHWFDRVEGADALLRKAVNDTEPRVRLEGVRALSFVPTVEAADAALDALRYPTDYYLDYVIDSTIATLEKVWKPALASGHRFAEDNPAGLAYLLARLGPDELTSLPRSEPVWHELLRRPGVDARYRREALDGLARAAGRTPVDELILAIGRLDGAPGTSAPARDLAAMLASEDRTTLGRVRTGLEQLANDGRHAVVRQGAWAALMRVDGPEAAWRRASSSARSRLDFIEGTALVRAEDRPPALYDLLAPVLSGTAPRGATTEPRIAGRYVRIVMPGRDRTLGLAEVEVQSGGANVAPKGSASQSSTVSGGAIGGHADNAIDGSTDRSAPGEHVAFTSQEQDPWWELDLGAEQPIDAVVLQPLTDGAGSRGGTLFVSILDAQREPVFVQDGLPVGQGRHTIAPGGDRSGALRAAALGAVARVPGREADAVALLSPFLRDDQARMTAIDALRAVPAERWPESVRSPLVEGLAAWAEGVAPADRGNADVRRAIAFGRDVASRLPGPEAARQTARFDALAVRVIRIVAVPSQMRFDIRQFTVEAGEEVEVVFFNPDEMPHNLLITAQGTLESVSLKAEAMASQPDAFQKHFVPDTRDVLQATPLINPGETARLRFTAPAETGGYPFVCTFPGHWRTMNGVMNVVRPATRESQ